MLLPSREGLETPCLNQKVPSGPVPSGLPAQAPQADQPCFSSTWCQVWAEEGGVGIRLLAVALLVEAMMSAVAVTVANAPVLSHTFTVIWCWPVLNCTVWLRVLAEVFCWYTVLESTYSAQPVIGCSPCAAALMVVGEEEPMGAMARDKLAAASVANPGMVTAVEALPEVPAVLVAVTLMRCGP